MKTENPDRHLTNSGTLYITFVLTTKYPAEGNFISPFLEHPPDLSWIINVYFGWRSAYSWWSCFFIENFYMFKDVVMKQTCLLPLIHAFFKTACTCGANLLPNGIIESPTRQSCIGIMLNFSEVVQVLMQVGGSLDHYSHQDRLNGIGGAYVVTLLAPHLIWQNAIANAGTGKCWHAHTPPSRKV